MHHYCLSCLLFSCFCCCRHRTVMYIAWDRLQGHIKCNMDVCIQDNPLHIASSTTLESGLKLIHNIGTKTGAGRKKVCEYVWKSSVNVASLRPHNIVVVWSKVTFQLSSKLNLFCSLVVHRVKFALFLPSFFLPTYLSSLFGVTSFWSMSCVI